FALGERYPLGQEKHRAQRLELIRRRIDAQFVALAGCTRHRHCSELRHEILADCESKPTAEPMIMREQPKWLHRRLVGSYASVRSPHEARERVMRDLSRIAALRASIRATRWSPQ